MKKQAHVISHSHWDREWYLPYEKHHCLEVEFMDRLLDTMERDPDFKSFHLDGQTIMLDDYLQVRPEKKELVEKLGEIPGMTSISLNINKKRNNVILGDKVKTIWGKEYITDKIGDISYEISPLSFFQVNPHQTCKLYSKAL